MVGFAFFLGAAVGLLGGCAMAFFADCFAGLGTAVVAAAAAAERGVEAAGRYQDGQGTYLYTSTVRWMEHILPGEPSARAVRQCIVRVRRE